LRSFAESLLLYDERGGQTIVVEGTEVKRDAWPKWHPNLWLCRPLTWILFACIVSVLDLSSSSAANASPGADPALMRPHLRMGNR
jgi:hypothetical protein